GATQVLAIDIDTAAPDVTVGNAQANGVAEFIEVSTDPLGDVTETFDVVVANMLASTLIELAPALIGVVRPRGRLVISGILDLQMQSVVEALQPLELLTTREREAVEQTWVVLTFG
ncbi:MAG TPA: 50S ribosomal protein L11 methyltransferase, partial [Acidimicrobiaceae bacterium]|nr:50S ribosomal protein L11 methyltransferase [Acidimicrobiaceae bacterium]